MRPLMLDLFSGTGGASAPFTAAGWEVIRVELDPSFPAEFHADVRSWSSCNRQPTLVWASPPCTEFARESMPWSRTGAVPSMELVNAADRIIRECDPDFWVIENVKGASRHLTPRYGKPLILGPVFLWGRFPRFRCRVPFWKERLSGKDRAKRAAIPWKVGDGLRRAIEGTFEFCHTSARVASPPG